jgi:hypothetical protein
MHKKFFSFLALFLSLTIFVTACSSHSIQSLASDIETAKEKDDSFEKDHVSQIKELFHKMKERLVFTNALYLASIDFYYLHNAFPLIHTSPPMRPPIFSV